MAEMSMDSGNELLIYRMYNGSPLSQEYHPHGVDLLCAFMHVPLPVLFVLEGP